MSIKEVRSINLVNIIKREVTRTRHPQARRLPTFYPSSASIQYQDGRVEGGCWRADWYRVNDVPPSNTNEFYISMIHRLGKAVENVIVDAMKDAGIFESAAVKFYDAELNVSGELDVVGRYRRPDGSIGYFIVEAKSVYGMGASETITGRSRAYKGQAAFRPKPKTSNLLQVMVYLDQFKKEKGDQFYLDGAKLVYFPRDKPNDGREYTVYLVTKEDLESLKETTMSDATRAEFLSQMAPGRHYALVITDDFPDYVEIDFSLEDMYDRWREQKALFEAGQCPPRPYKKVYSKEEVEYLVSIEEMAKSVLEDWEKGKERPGHYLCKSYCEYRSFCYNANGTPRKEADEIVPKLTQIRGAA